MLSDYRAFRGCAGMLIPSAKRIELVRWEILMHRRKRAREASIGRSKADQNSHLPLWSIHQCACSAGLTGRPRLSPIMRCAAIVASFIGTMFSVTGCTASADPLTDSSTIEDGRHINALVQTLDTAVVLVYDPSQCLACVGYLGEWMRLAGENRLDLHLVLSRRPLPVEDKQLTMARLHPDGFLRAPPRDMVTPRVYVFVRGVPVDSAFGLSGQSVLLKKF